MDDLNEKCSICKQNSPDCILGWCDPCTNELYNIVNKLKGENHYSALKAFKRTKRIEVLAKIWSI